MTALVPTHPGDRAAWPWLPSLVRPCGCYCGPTGEVLRIYENGRVVVLGLQPRPWSSAYYPTAGLPLVTR